jgi:hypothetical protein
MTLCRAACVPAEHQPWPCLQELLGLSEAMMALVPLDVVLCDRLPPALLAAGALSSEAQATPAAELWATLCALSDRRAALRRVAASASRMAAVLEAAGVAVEACRASALQQSYWRYVHPKVGGHVPAARGCRYCLGTTQCCAHAAASVQAWRRSVTRSTVSSAESSVCR